MWTLLLLLGACVSAKDVGKSSDDTPQVEVCNGEDDDLDGLVDEDPIDIVAWYLDIDSDGWGDTSTALVACPGAPGTEGRTLQAGDCEDTDPAIHPFAEELCDDVDQDCDGLMDEDPADAEPSWVDDDGDGFGQEETLAYVCDEDGRALASGDCDDDDPELNPSATELCDDGIDNDCDGFLLGCNGLKSGLVNESSALLTAFWKRGLGSSTAGPGDLDGDGLHDLLVGESAWVSGRPVIRAFSGPLTGSRRSEEAVASITGHATFGEALAGPGDVNGDGFDDVLVGSYGTSEVDLFCGPLLGDLDHSEADVTITSSSDALLGFSVAGAGDQSGDGLPDLALGAFGGEGTMHLLQGSATSLDEAFFVLRGTPSASGLRAVALAGDVNGDGQPDLIFSRLSKASEDEVALVLGPALGDIEFPNADLLIEGTGHALGMSLAGVHDTDADGYDDVLLWAPNGGPGGAWLYTGHPTSLLRPRAHLEGAIANDEAGYAVAGPGDLDGDGFADLVVGAPWAQVDDLHYVGWAAIRLGPISGTLPLQDSEGFLTGSEYGQGAGRSLAGLGDTTGDGSPDLLIGLPCIAGSSRSDAQSQAALFSSFAR